MELIFSPKFEHAFKKLDFENRERVMELLRELEEKPDIGKPLRYSLRGFRSVRVGKYRLIYEIKGDIIRVHTFEHRKKVYE